jgi:hypothetical protein
LLYSLHLLCGHTPHRLLVSSSLTGDISNIITFQQFAVFTASPVWTLTPHKLLVSSPSSSPPCPGTLTTLLVNYLLCLLHLLCRHTPHRLLVSSPLPGDISILFNNLPCLLHLLCGHTPHKLLVSSLSCFKGRNKSFEVFFSSEEKELKKGLHSRKVSSEV